MSGQPAARAGDAIAQATQALAAFGQLKLRLTGTSMLPALRPGDVVEFHSFQPSEAATGEIVLFRRDGALVAHRVVGCTADSLITQGDSLGALDEAVAHADVLGRGVGLTRRNRPVPWSVARRPSWHVSRWWFRRFDLATRIWLRWHRFAARIAA